MLKMIGVSFVTGALWGVVFSSFGWIADTDIVTGAVNINPLGLICLIIVGILNGVFWARVAHKQNW